jgi:hypothetical protein
VDGSNEVVLPAERLDKLHRRAKCTHAMAVGGDPVATQDLRRTLRCLDGIEIYVLN